MQIRGNDFLVTGGAGFIGSHVVEQLYHRGARKILIVDNIIRGNVNNFIKAPNIYFIKEDIRNEAIMRSLIQTVDGVFHTAALWLLHCQQEQHEAFSVNTFGTFAVANAVRFGKKGTKLVFSSSASVYGNALTEPMTEDHPLNNKTFYGATKIASEQFIKTMGIPYVTLRYMNVYGPKQANDGAYSGVVVQTISRLKQMSKPIVDGDGSDCFDFVHVEDVAIANVMAMESEVESGEYNISTGVKTSVMDLVTKIVKYSGRSTDIIYRGQQRSDIFVKNRVGSTEKALNDFGFKAKISLDEGLRSLVELELN